MLDDLDAAERIRKDLLTQLLDEDRAALHEAILRAVRDRGDSESELRFRSGGRGRWIRVRIRLLSRAGNLSNLYLLAEETTQEQALRDRLAATRDTIPGGLAFYEVADRIRLLDFSDAAADMIGYTREEYQARTLDDALAVVHPEDRARVEAVAAELDAGASRSSCTMRVLRGDGKVAWLHLSASTMYRDETALYVVAVLIDVTNEKENEQRLKAQSELQCRLSDSVPCGIVRYTVDDEPRVLFVNRTGCEIFGYADFAAYRAGTAGGKIVPIHDDDDELHAKTVAALKAGAAPIGFTYRFVRSDGSMGWIEGTSALERDIDGRTVVQSAFLDVSDRQQKRYEQDIHRYSMVLCSVYDEIVEWRHVNHAFLVGELSSVGGGFIEHIAVQHHVGTVGLGGIDLQRRGDLRHADGGLGSTLAGRIGHTLGMVAGRRGDDAVSDLLFGERSNLVIGTADLEGSGDLQVFRLQENLMAGHLAQHRRRNDLRVAGSAFESFGGQLQFGCMITLQRLQNILLFHSFPL